MWCQLRKTRQSLQDCVWVLSRHSGHRLRRLGWKAWPQLILGWAQLLRLLKPGRVTESSHCHPPSCRAHEYIRFGIKLTFVKLTFIHMFLVFPYLSFNNPQQFHDLCHKDFCLPWNINCLLYLASHNLIRMKEMYFIDTGISVCFVVYHWYANEENENETD